MEGEGMGTVAAFVWIVAGVIVCVGTFFVGFLSGAAWFRGQSAADMTRFRKAVSDEERAKVWHGRN
jgi:hypothetical protein